MYRKKGRGWTKHADFMLIDVLCMQLAFIVSYIVRFGISNPYTDSDYRILAIAFLFIDFFVEIVSDSFKNVLKRGYFDELTATCKHVILVELVAAFYLFTTQMGSIYSRFSYYIMVPFYIAISYAARLTWKKILQKKGYEELSIKNICEEAGVSNGSFYHHFKTKDDLLSYYIEEQPTINPDLLEIPENAGGVEQGIIQVYMNYVKYCRELGVEFMSGYYDTKNQALNAAIRTERPYPIVTVQTYVEKAIEAGVVKLNVSIEEFTTDIRMIVIGNVFEWCLRNGEADFEGNMSRSLGKYLESTLCEVEKN